MLEKFFPFLLPKERFLVVEILSQFVRISFLKVNFDKKILEVGKVIFKEYQLANQNSPLELVKKLLRNFGKLSRYKIILSLDPALATTIYSTVVLLRDKPKEPIDDSDLDNRIAQGIWRLFDRERSHAALKMKVKDLDVLLTDVKVKKIKLDGHKVVNPIGFKAKTLEIQFSQTFNPRSFVVEIKKIIPAEQVMLMAEAGTLEADILTKASGLSNFLLLDLMSDRTHIFLSDGGTIAYLNTCVWGHEHLIGSLADFFSVSPPVAEKIFKLYLIQRASPAVLKKIEKLLVLEFEQLINFLAKPLAKYDCSCIYLMPFSDLPEFVYSYNLRSSLRSKTKFLPANLTFISEHLGFHIKCKPTLAPSIFPTLAGLLGFYFSPHDDKMNRIARRHARWLIS